MSLIQYVNSEFEDLLCEKTSSLIIPNVLPESECVAICKKIFSNCKTSSSPGVTSKIGTSLSSYIYEKSQYFSNSEMTNLLIQNLFSELSSPIKKMHDVISQITGKQILTASEKGMLYSDCVIRIHKDGDSVHLHRDNSNFEMPDYDVSQCKNQLSAILYLQTPHSGGDLTLFDKKWCKDDEYMRDPEFGYQSNIVDGATKSSISPVVGNMVILNPKFYHKIESVQGTKHRVSIGFFFAEHSSNNLCAWA